MKSFFSLDSPFFRICGVLTDLTVLNLLWLLCCLPVFTAGAATAALYDVLLRMVRKESAAIAKPFFAAFRSNFKKATLEWLIMLSAALLLVAEYYLLSAAELSPFYLSIPILGTILWLFVCAYLFPLTARFENSIANTFKNALILSAANFPRTLLVAALQVSPFILAVEAFDIFYKTGFLWLLLGGSGIAYINSLMLTPVFAVLTGKADD